MKNSNRIISFILALLMMMGTVMIPSPSYAYGNGNNDRFDEAEYHITEENGKLYKEYNYDDVKPKMKTGFNLFMVGDPLPYSINVVWTTFDLIPSDVGADIKFSIYDSFSRKIIAETDKITENTNDFEKEYVFKETVAYSDSDVSKDTSTWRMRVPNEYRFDVRVKNADSGFSATSGMQALVAQYATPIYRAEYFTSKNIPELEAYKRDTDDIVKEITINPTNLGENEFYSFGTKESGSRFYYAGKQLNISHFEMQDNLVKLEISEPVVANRVQLYAKAPGATDYDRQGSFTDTANANTPHHYLVTGNYKTPHIITVREDLKVNFDPNGGTWANAEEGQEQTAKSFVIGHSMNIGESWGDIEAINIPANNEITPPTSTAEDGTIKKNEMLGWSTDKDATEPMTEKEIQAIEVKEDTTLYAIYSELEDGKAKVKYVDNNNGAEIDITDDQKIDGETYPVEKAGSLDEAIPQNVFTKDTAPKLRGYEFVRVDINPDNGTFNKDGSATIKLLYKAVAPIVKDETPEDTSDKPEGYVEVRFKSGEKGKINDDIKDVLYYVNPKAGKTNNDLTEPTITADTGYTVAPKKWYPEFNAETVITTDATYTAQYTVSEDIIPGTDSETHEPNAKPVGYVTVEFLPGENGTIEGETKYYVNPEAGKKNSDLVEPDVIPKPGFKVADSKWYPEFNAETVITTDATYTAQYTALDDVIPDTTPETDDDRPEGYVTVNFDEGEHGSLKGTTKYFVKKDTLVELKAPTVMEDTDYKFTEWNKPLTAKYGEDTTITAQYKAKVVAEDPKDGAYVKVNFSEETNGTFAVDATTEYWVLRGEEVNLTAPTVTGNTGYAFKEWSPEVKVTYDADTTHKAQYTYNGKDVVPQDPGEDKPQVPASFIKVEFKSGDHGSIANTETVIYWVNPEREVTVKAPNITAKEGYKHTGWDQELTQIFKSPTDITATYKAKVVTTDPSDTDYVKVDFNAGDRGSFEDNQTTEYWVLKGETVSLTAPSVTPKDKYAFNGWDPKVATSYDEDTTHKAQYAYNGENVIPIQDRNNPPEKPEGFVTVNFDKGEHGEFTQNAVTQYYVKEGTLVSLTAPTVTAGEGYKHTGWDSVLTRSFSDEETAITAQYKAKVVTTDPQDGDYVKVHFTTSKGSLNGTSSYWVLRNQAVTITPPIVEDLMGYEFAAWDPVVRDSYGSDIEHKATFNYIGQDIVPQKPGEDKPQVPASYVKVEFKPGDHGSIANTETVIYWVNPEREVTVKAPNITAKEGYKHTGWDQELTQIFKSPTDITATYKAKVVTTDPSDTDYVKVDFSAEDRGSFEDDQTTEYWVLKGETVSLTAPSVTPKDKYAFNGWDPKVATSYNENTTHKAQYDYNGENVIPVEPGTEKPEGFITVKFEAGDHGQITAGTTEYYVKKDTLVSLTAPTVQANADYNHTGWDQKLIGKFTNDPTTITAQYEAITVPEPEQFRIKYLSMDTTMGTVTRDSETLTEGATPKGSTAKPAEGYEFVRWMDVENPADTSLTNATLQLAEAKNATYIAIFKAAEPEPTNELTVWYVPADATMGHVSLDKETITEGQTVEGSIASSNDETKYQFIKWIDANGNDVSTDSKLIPNVEESTVFVAVFEEIKQEPVKHTISFNANGGDGSMADIEVLEGAYTLPVSGLTRDGYNFTGWKVDGMGNTLKAGETIPVTKDIELVAQWEKIPVTPEPTTYTVSYGSGSSNATGTMNSAAVEENQAYTIASNKFENKGYKFTGWKIDGEGEILNPGDTIIITKDTTLVAQWEEIKVPPTPKIYTVTYHSGSENATGAMNQDTVKENEKYTVLRNGFQYTDHEFIGWLIEGTNTIVLPGDTINLEKDTTLVAQWKETSVNPKPEPTEKVTISYRFKAEDGDRLPNRVTNLLPKNDYVDEGKTVKAPVKYTNVRVYDNGGYWTFVKWTPAQFTNVKLNGNYTFVGTWRWNKEEPTPDPKPDKPGGNFTPGWTGEEKSDVKETGRHTAYLKGYPDDTIRADRQITRAEAATMIARLEGLDMSNSNRPQFTDIKSNWYNSAINAVTEKGLMQGYPDGTFNANAPITRAEFAQLIKNINHKSYINKGLPFEDVRGHWGYPAIDKAYSTGLITGYPDGTFRPDRQITRAEVVRIVNNLYNRRVDKTGLAIVVNKTERFEDLNRSHWAYFDLIEASNTHSYVRRETGKIMENWIEINR